MKTQIRLGHPAYSGINAVYMANSKAAAVRELRARGATRNAARDAVNGVCKRVAGYATMELGHQVVEILHWAGIDQWGKPFTTTASGIQIYPVKLRIS